MGRQHVNLDSEYSAELYALEEAVDRFEQSWRTGNRPAIEDYCRPDVAQPEALLLELALIDIEYRVKSGESAIVEDYLERFPGLARSDSAVIDLVAAERRWRSRSDTPQPEDSQSRSSVPEPGPRIDSEPGNVALSEAATARGTQDCRPNGCDDFNCATTSLRNDSQAEGSAPSIPVDPTSSQREAIAQITALGRFRPLELLGEGAFGRVYLAVDLELDRVVALKIPRAGLAGSKEEREHLLREARSAAQLRHANIVPVYEVCSEGTHHFIVSALVTGQTLAAILETRPPDFRDSAEIIAILADALHYAHQQHVVHRDVKPSNIMIDEQGIPVLMDFGLAKRDGVDVSTTLEGHVVGTPAYMSPEQALGNVSRIDARSDVYSLGVVFYELLAGQRPFHGSVKTLIDQVANDEPRSPRTINAQVPRDLATICMKCLHKRPGARYQTARDLADDLRRFQNGDPIHARPVSLAEKVWRRVRQRPLTATLAATAVGLAVTLSGVAAVARYRIYHAQQRAEVEATRATDADVIAQQATQTSLRQSERLYLAHGDAAADAGHFPDALPWIVKAWEVDRPNAARDSIYRARLVTALRQAPKLIGLLSVPGSVNNAERSPDGQLLALACSDGIAAIFDLRHPESRPEMLRHDGAVMQCVFDPQGDRFATVSYDRKVRVWPARGPNREPIVLPHPNFPMWAAFSPDSQWIATACRDGIVRIWNPASEAPPTSQLKQGGSVKHLAFNTDGTLLATASSNHTARIWSVSTRQPIGATLGHDGSINQIAFSPDSRYVVTASADCTARIWDLVAHKLSATLAHDADVMRVLFSHSGGAIVTGSADGVVKVWNPATGMLIHALPAHKGRIFRLSLSKDDLLLATASDDKTARVWDMTTGRPVCPPLRHADAVSAIELSDDRKTLTTAGFDGLVKVWTIKPALEPAFSVDLAKSPGKVPLVSAGHHLLFKTVSGHQVLDYSQPGAPVVVSVPQLGPTGAVSLASDRPWIASVLANGDVTIWDWKANADVRTFRHTEREVKLSRFAPQTGVLLTADVKGTVTLQSVLSDLPAVTLSHQAPLRGAEFGATGDVLVTVGADDSIRTWDVAAGRLRFETTIQGRDVTDWRIAPHARQVVPMKQSTTWELHDASSGATLHAFRHRGLISSAVFSPDGSRLGTASEDNTARVWDTTTGKPLTSALPHRDDVTCCAFSPDGAMIATGSKDRTARIWDARTGDPASRYLQHSDGVIFLGFGPEGTELISVAADGTVRVWDLNDRTATREELARLVRLNSGQEIDESGSAVPVAPARLEQDWADVNRSDMSTH